MSIEKKEKEIAEKVFGKTLININGGCVLDYQELVIPFEDDDSIIKCFCKNCGFLFEVDNFLLEFLLNGKKINLPNEILKEDYLEFSYCSICVGDRETHVKLKKLSAN